MTSDSFGVYVHIPFCAQRCDYCAFVTYVGVDALHERYVDAVLSEFERAHHSRPLPIATSIYFGGGTPSRLDPSLIGKILDAIPRSDDCEVTIEVNPEDATAERLVALVGAGVTRISLGIQSTAPHVLKELGRVHRGDDVRSIARSVSESGVASWSMDLIIGAASERDEDLVDSLNAVIGHEHRPPHLSCYLLTVEKGTPLSLDSTRYPDDDVLARRYELVDSYLETQGYSWYEVSNWSIPNHESRHNQLYWDQGSYLGLGCAAHSHTDGHRSWNVASLNAYLNRVEAGGDPIAGEEYLDEVSRSFESLALALRTRKGVAWPHGSDFEDLAGYLVEADGRLVLTRSGRLLANDVTQRVAIASVTSVERAASAN